MVLFAAVPGLHPPVRVLQVFENLKITLDQTLRTKDDESVWLHIHMWANIFTDDAEQESTASTSDWQPSLWSASYLYYTTYSWLDINSEIQGTTSLFTLIS